MMITCYIGIGSNLGERRKYIDEALKTLRGSEHVEVKRVSSIYETEPVSDIPQGKFLNGVVEIDTDLDPRGLMKVLNNIEKTLGRVRTVKNGPRTMDLDILYYGDENINGKDLVVPHPKINEREFVLKGLRELGVI